MPPKSANLFHLQISFIAKLQLKQIKNLKSNLAEGEAVLQEDFSENLIMSAHWITAGITLFTAIITMRDKNFSYVLVSNELDHDKYSVLCFNQAIFLDMEQTAHIQKLHVYSDGAASQFKNRYSISTILRPDLLHKNLIFADWNFFATAHGKGPVDGVGGTVKRAVWRRILQGNIVVNTAKEFADAARDSCPNIRVLYIDKEAVDAIKEKYKHIWTSACINAVPETQRMHYFRAKSDTEVEFCDIGLYSEFTWRFNSTKMFEKHPKQQQEVNSVPFESNLESPPERDEELLDVTPSGSWNLSFEIGDYIVVVYDSKNYPGTVSEVGENACLVSAMHPTTGGWKWPNTKDEIWYPPTKILRKIQHPVPINNRGVFTFGKEV